MLNQHQIYKLSNIFREILILIVAIFLINRIYDAYTMTIMLKNGYQQKIENTALIWVKDDN